MLNIAEAGYTVDEETAEPTEPTEPTAEPVTEEPTTEEPYNEKNNRIDKKS